MAVQHEKNAAFIKKLVPGVTVPIKNSNFWWQS